MKTPVYPEAAEHDHWYLLDFYILPSGYSLALICSFEKYICQKNYFENSHFQYFNKQFIICKYQKLPVHTVI